ncbi:hypothetical protein [Sulfitobacter sp. TMED3]|uniref:hypothetical protein n=1 Tax=Sulfitobacter sp. TMED3 TaxID=1986591 RepID=UPI00257CFB0A|nr:hypothetical protein [Sulfitobacter sp. TMED3]|tara:strand:+ start:203 stop:946 length:744 start_codon:yes stop_codon:yes gene_type:complete
MLHAILSSKSGRIHSGDTVTKWRDIFRGSEDLITATVIERLSYLSGPTAWSILRKASGNMLDDFRVGELVEIEFWPMWEHQERKLGVEPDVFMQFDLGDPVKRYHLIVESKFWGNSQDVNQWAYQLSAYGQLLQSEELQPADSVVYLAIGGVKNSMLWRENMLAELGKEKRFQAANIEKLSFGMIGWMELVKACCETNHSSPEEKRILKDMIKGLGLYGYSYIETPRQLEAIKPLRTAEQTLALLSM